jgi:hypothetical protein
MLRDEHEAVGVSRQTGTYYTPANLAYDIADQALRAFLNSHIGNPLDTNLLLDDLNENDRERNLKHLENIAVLDPAVGEGVFLKAAGQWLETTRRALGDDRSVQVLRSEIVERNLFGVDVRQDAVSICSDALSIWSGAKNPKHLKREILSKTVKHGNSLIGWSEVPENCDQANMKCFDRALLEKLHSLEEKKLNALSPFHWPIEYDDIMKEGGFDVVLGNPPYGNILSKLEKRIIVKTRKIDVSTSRNGTWNIAALFIARSADLLRAGGHLGFLIPNSVLRTKQFYRARIFLLEEMPIWKIVDEASPFEDVTLEMVSIFCEAGKESDHPKVQVESRRPNVEWNGSVPRKILKSSQVFPIYYDAILARILDRTTKGWAMARRGRDLPKSHVRKKKAIQFQVPYATSGRSVKRFQLDSRYLLFADDTYRRDSGLRESHENNLLVATKNYPYPRCVMKPRGMIHGGGVVEIIPLRDDIQLEALGLILNSNIVKYMCVKYLTNYSQLTTCLNTGIMEELPLMMPKDQAVFKQLFKALQDLHQDAKEDSQLDAIASLEEIANALVYEMFLTDSNKLLEIASKAISEISEPISTAKLVMALSGEEVSHSVRGVMDHKMVRLIESAPRMQR